jgi:hypothetical protein
MRANMKTINIVCDFKDDGREFYAGERRCVTPEKSSAYITNGWATDAGDPNATPVERDLTEKKLDVQSTRHVNKAVTIGKPIGKK